MDKKKISRSEIIDLFSNPDAISFSNLEIKDTVIIGTKDDVHTIEKEFSLCTFGDITICGQVNSFRLNGCTIDSLRITPMGQENSVVLHDCQIKNLFIENDPKLELSARSAFVLKSQAIEVNLRTWQL